MDQYTKKINQPVVINNNKSSLREAKRRKRLSKNKDEKIDDLESRIQKLEELFSKQ